MHRPMLGMTLGVGLGGTWGFIYGVLVANGIILASTPLLIIGCAVCGILAGVIALY